ncbi:MAG: response regulator [Gemmatimonadetes bacterium]|nr:sigma-54-dependent Fis family transcriptional regulator [Gemmatimonadota bacterium]NIR80291.1 sigma-54-dependent Fis family transcriptional regulator [Gemmatimonadota bacterium]NIT89056.1 sigma-54-dependent Fis family transcriptional regulator [Gemmatimonadota bacterium]NIU32851.1 sigma-54-dependent Fis family transcriptional regulator [Gemmatimonadota bacterium]NIU37264.1 response regulator [Gemmatimonadota bacterium]
MAPSILVVDDDADHLRVICDKLEHAGFEVTGADDAEAALARIQRADPAVILTDLRLPGMDGLELLERVRSDMDGVDVVVMTGHEDMTSAVEAMKKGAFDYLVKPIGLSQLEDLVRRCLREQELARKMEKERDDGEEEDGRQLLVGRDPRMIEIYKLIGVLSRNRATVLIRGETGTGKEMIARAIHDNSAHADAPFLAVNCTALSDTLLESELFGHVKGAFTGAVSSRKGYFELAGTGTIFLDEIGDTSPEFQTKLLRVLQERTFYPVGGERPRQTEARVIAATHQPVEALVREGRFREDLYFRLKVVEIHVPPLRERKGDISLLAGHLLDRIRQEIHQDVRHISDAAMEKLEAYRWPGNVRELENALTRAAILSRGRAIGAEHVSLEPAEPGVDEDGDGVPSLEAAIARHVKSVLKRTKGDREEAARLLDISRKRLDGLVDEHGLEAP